MKRVAVFGARGYLGRQLIHYFTRKGVVCEGFDVPECDVVDISFWESFDPAGYDAIVFFAGLTGTEKGFDEAVKYTQVNEFGLLNLLKKLAPLGGNAPRVVFPSSRLVYKGASLPLDENAEKETRTVYAVNKLACEGYLFAFSNRFGIPYNVIRICVPYGSLTSAEYSYGTIGFFLKQISDGRPIALFGGGDVERTFTHVEDICTAVELLAGGERNGVYNVGGTDLSLFEAAGMIAAQNNARVESVPWPESALLIESGSTKFDSSALQKDFGWRARHAFADHVREMRVS